MMGIVFLVERSKIAFADAGHVGSKPIKWFPDVAFFTSYILLLQNLFSHKSFYRFLSK